MESINFIEIIIVNGIGAFLMIFLKLTRIENIEKRIAGDKLFDAMISITTAGCLVEILTFVINGREFVCAETLSYILNSLCFIGTCSVGYLWCLYVDFRIFNSISRLRRRAKILAVPLAVDVLINIINLSGCGIIFIISDDNVYIRGSLAIVVYIVLFFYFIYSIVLMERSKRSGLHVRFFPLYCFVVPCIVGTIIQGCFYGVTLGWTSVAVALMLIYIQIQSLNTFVDPLSGLYNRKYMDYILSQVRYNQDMNLYGIMIDVNDFKSINDVYGHSSGDDAIRTIGVILSDAAAQDGLAVRYAGDEFIVLLKTDSQENTQQVMKHIREESEHFNETSGKPYRISFAMGCSKFDAVSGDVEKFLSDLDSKMYADKRSYYRDSAVDRRRK